jgi:hypothetical protein
VPVVSLGKPQRVVRQIANEIIAHHETRNNVRGFILVGSEIAALGARGILYAANQDDEREYGQHIPTSGVHNVGESIVVESMESRLAHKFV